MKNKPCIPNLLSCIILYIAISGCVTKQYIITSAPKGSLVISGNPKFDFLPPEIIGLTPANKKILFLGKKDTRYITSIKRGYSSDTVMVTKNSALNINLNLQPLEGISTEIFNKEKLKNATCYLLPVHTEIFLHKGVGKLDKYVKSDELTNIASDSINSKLKRTHLNERFLYIPEEKMENTIHWKTVSEKLNKQLLVLNSDFLDYYPTAPKIKEVSIVGLLNNTPVNRDSSSFLIYIWCKSIKPTAGRVIGNVAAVAAGGAVAGYQTAAYGAPITYFDPSAFVMDNSTLWIAYFIEANSGEVVCIKQKTLLNDLTNAKCLQAFIEMLTKLPEIN